MHFRRNARHPRIAANDPLWPSLDRVNVLDGHSGCVNALAWSPDGELLLSGGDDQTVRIWRVDEQATADTPLPYTTRAVVRTGHSANIFSAQFLSPSPDLIATCAGDGQVRLFDLRRTSGAGPAGPVGPHKGIWDDTPAATACLRVFKCHTGRVKRILTENTPHHFLSVAEDGSVRQHDLRAPHLCHSTHGECPPPLVSLPFELSTIAMSMLSPYYFVVAGESPHAFLFDRRHSKRSLRSQWGFEPPGAGITTCVRRFGRRHRGTVERPGQEHITGSRMSQYSSHELLLSYSADAVYLYNTQDDEQQPPTERSASMSLPTRDAEHETSTENASSELGDDILTTPVQMGTDSDSSTESSEDDSCVLPRMRFAGACNVETVKDVNFLGQMHDHVVSGSDDGNFFIWSKKTGKLVNILQGDESVVNVVEQNPVYACCAVSGIDHTIKLFARSSPPIVFSKMSEKDDIMKTNAAQSGHFLSQRARLYTLLARYRLASSDDDSGEGTCVHQ